jgi:carbon-monoxide dehydrogenase medium subunit
MSTSPADRPPEYRAARTVDEAIELLATEGAHVLAGGTDVVTMRAAGAFEVARLVDVKRVVGMSDLSCDQGWNRIGATASLDAIARSGALGPSALVDGAGVVGGWQTRCRATLGGNICRASPAGDTLTALLVDDARLELRSARAAREVAARDFFIGPGATVRARDELLVSVAIPSRPGASAYARFTYRNAMDLAVVGVAARISVRDGSCDGATIAIGASGPTPMLVPAAGHALVGSQMTDDAIAAASAAVVASARPIDDVRGTGAFRRRVLEPLAGRVIREALRRAIGAEGSPS